MAIAERNGEDGRVTLEDVLKNEENNRNNNSNEDAKPPKPLPDPYDYDNVDYDALIQNQFKKQEELTN